MQDLSVRVSWVKADWRMGAVDDRQDVTAAAVIDDVARRTLPWAHNDACAGGEWSCVRRQIDNWSLWHANVAAHPLVEETLSGAHALTAGPVDWLWDVAREGTERFLRTLPACWGDDVDGVARGGSELSVAPLRDALMRAALSLLLTPAPAARQQRIVASILRALSCTHGGAARGDAVVEL